MGRIIAARHDGRSVNGKPAGRTMVRRARVMSQCSAAAAGLSSAERAFELVEVRNRSHFEPIGARTEREFRYGLLPHLVVKRDHASLVCLRL